MIDRDEGWKRPLTEEELEETGRDLRKWAEPGAVMREIASRARPTQNEDVKRKMDGLLARILERAEAEPEEKAEAPVRLVRPIQERIGGQMFFREYARSAWVDRWNLSLENVPGGKATVMRIYGQMQDWARERPSGGLAILVNGMQGRGKTRLVHLMVVELLREFQHLRAVFERDRIIRQDIIDRQNNTYFTHDPVYSWLNEMHEVMVVDEFSKGSTNHGYCGVWLDILDKLDKSSRLLILIMNRSFEELRRNEATVKDADGTTPVSSRLMQATRLELTGRDWRDPAGI